MLALSRLNDRLNYLKSLDYQEKYEDLIYSVLAGNIFDRGASDIIHLLKDEKFDLAEARKKLPCKMRF